MTIDLQSRTVHRPEGRLPLSPTEARLLAYLAERPRERISQATLLEQVWSYRPRVYSRTVVSTIERLRRKVEVDAIAPVCDATDGHPLAIALVAPWLALVAPDALAPRACRWCSTTTRRASSP